MQSFKSNSILLLPISRCALGPGAGLSCFFVVAIFDLISPSPMCFKTRGEVLSLLSCFVAVAVSGGATEALLAESLRICLVTVFFLSFLFSMTIFHFQ